MEQFGDFFPENPQTLDELLEQLAQRMAAMQAMLNSMTPEQRAQLQELVRPAARRHGPALADGPARRPPAPAVPADGLEPVATTSQGQDPMGFGQAMQTMQDLGDLDQLENLLRNASNPGALAEADMDRVRDLLGDDAARSLERLAELTRMLDEAGLIEQQEGRLELTPKGLRAIGSNALRDLFSKLTKDQVGQHQVHRLGHGHERTYDTKPYEYGDPFQLDLQRTIRNALARGRGARHAGAAASPTTSRSSAPSTSPGRSTVLMLDLSLSMPMRDNFLPAKKVAMALHSLISSQFPRDYLGLVGFSETARDPHGRAAARGVSWDFVYGTNMQHGFTLARQLLARQTRHQADHHDHRRRADGPHHAERRRVLQLPAGAARPSRRRCARCCAAPARASASTRSCSTPRAT